MVVTVFSAATISSCIKGETPETDVKGVFIEFEADGQKKAAINAYDRTVVVDLPETVNPASVKISKMVLPEGGTCFEDLSSAQLSAGSVIDLSSPLKVTIKTHAAYGWTISATQTIERVFEIENQVGASYFEESSRSVFAYVPKGTDMSAITVEKIKLGPESTSANQTKMTPDLNGETVSFRKSASDDEFCVREVKVEYRGKTETWYLYVGEAATGTNDVPRGDVWATFATVTGTVLESDPESVEFGWRKAGTEDEWQYVTATAYGAYDYSGRITGLEPATEYEACIRLDGEFIGRPVCFTTETAQQPLNPGFDNWHQNGNPWFPYGSGDTPYWDTGNKGSTVISASSNVTNRDTDVRPGSTGTYSTYMKSRFVGLLSAGQFAAGNIYVGRFVKTNVSNFTGIVEFGKGHTSRPTSLKGWYKASPGIVNYAKSNAPVAKNDNDAYSIYVCLTDWNEPYQVDTADASTFMKVNPDPNGQNYDPNIIAYGELTGTAAVEDWTNFEIPLKYRFTDRIPKYICIVCSASKYGDYFTGSTDSWMYVDDFELVYNDAIVLQD